MKKNKTLLFMTFLVWLVGSLLTGPLTSLAAASEQADIRKVRVGYFEFPRYHELQEKGAGAFDSGTGYGCDFLFLLRRYAKLNYEFVGYDKSWQDMLDMLRRGEIDMVTSATKNEERLKEFAFSEPIGKSMAIISVKKDDQRYHYSDYKSFDGMVLGAIVGNSRNADLARFAKLKGFSYTTKMYRTADEVKKALQRGEVDGIISSNLRNYSDEKIVASFAAHDFYAIVRKGDQKLLEEINYGIQQMDLHEGDWRNVLHYKYYASTANGLVFSQREQAYIDAVKSGRKKIVATAMPDTDPYSYVENGKLVGIIPDYFAYLMDMAGLPYEVKIAKDRKEFEQWVFNDSVNAFMDGRPASPNTPLSASYGVVTEPYMPLAIARANKRSYDVLGKENVPQFVYITKNTDRELASILSKCIKADNSDRLDELVDKYTTFDKDNFSLMRMVKLKPWPFVALLLTFLGGGIIIFLISRNNRTMRKMAAQQQALAASLQEKNEQLERSVLLEQQANKARREFLCHMSHDIRTPMNAIIGFTEIAKQQTKDKEIGTCLEKISRSSEHLLDLINNVLDMSRIESGNDEYRPVPVELSTVTDAVLNIMTGFLANRDLHFEVQRPVPNEEHIWVLTDSVRLREILVNILGNAVKFTKDGGHIQLQEEILPSHNAGEILVQYTITDTGVGMSKEFMEHLFDEFTQESRDARTLYRGSGLGMAITKRYVEMMGGSIQVDSKKGQGTTFVVVIPMEVTKVPKQAILGEAEKFSLEGVHVLLAEDNDLNAEIAMLQLEKQGMVVKRVENGQEAVETFAEQPAGSFDVILMDIMMPLMNGYEATKAIRSMESRPDAVKIPIIAMTANAFAEDVEAAHAAGMDAHLSKPIDMKEVLQTLRRCLQNQK